MHIIHARHTAEVQPLAETAASQQATQVTLTPPHPTFRGSCCRGAAAEPAANQLNFSNSVSYLRSSQGAAGAAALVAAGKRGGGRGCACSVPVTPPPPPPPPLPLLLLLLLLLPSLDRPSRVSLLHRCCPEQGQAGAPGGTGAGAAGGSSASPAAGVGRGGPVHVGRPAVLWLPGGRRGAHGRVPLQNRRRGGWAVTSAGTARGAPHPTYCTCRCLCMCMRPLRASPPCD